MIDRLFPVNQEEVKLLVFTRLVIVEWAEAGKSRKRRVFMSTLTRCHLKRALKHTGTLRITNDTLINKRVRFDRE